MVAWKCALAVCAWRLTRIHERPRNCVVLVSTPRAYDCICIAGEVEKIAARLVFYPFSIKIAVAGTPPTSAILSPWLQYSPHLSSCRRRHPRRPVQPAFLHFEFLCGSKMQIYNYNQNLAKTKMNSSHHVWTTKNLSCVTKLLWRFSDVFWLDWLISHCSNRRFHFEAPYGWRSWSWKIMALRSRSLGMEWGGAVTRSECSFASVMLYTGLFIFLWLFL